MKRRFEVRWYELNLTERKSRKFFTELGAEIFKWYLGRRCDAYAKVYEI
jgi:hypothetical protein